ncbi:MAG: GNAT family N-acetyltransferase [Acidimicrobiales bacterium]|nr:GNAT family N-acetyltransferase [Acidimicrobiales bacterium]
MSGWTIRDVTPQDLLAVRAVNAANEPEVGPFDDARTSLFLASAERFQAVEVDGDVVGVFVGLVEGLDYQSPNYRWFCDRHARFAYVDRIALQPVVRGRGVAAAIYQDFTEWSADSGRNVVCAEVNTEPPNPRSLAFHRRQGFEVVAEIAPYGGGERVAMVEKVL